MQRSDLTSEERQDRRDLASQLDTLLASVRLMVYPYSERSAADFQRTNRMTMFDGSDVQALRRTIEALRRDVGTPDSVESEWADFADAELQRGAVLPGEQRLVRIPRGDPSA